MEATLTKPGSKDSKKPKESKKITFRAIRPRTQLAVKCSPCNDKTGRLWTGQGEHGYFELLSPEEKAKLRFIIGPQTVIIIEDGKVMDLADPMDAANAKWLFGDDDHKGHPYVAKSRAAALSSRDAVYFIEDPETDAKLYIDDSSDKDKARFKVRELSYKDQIHAAKTLGLAGADGFSPDQLLRWLLQQSDIAPKAVLVAIDPEQVAENNASIFFNDAELYKVIERFEDGSFRFGGSGGQILGHSREACIAYLLNKENATIVKVIQSKLTESKKD